MEALRQAGVAKRSLHRPVELTPWAEAVLLGTLLGDGHLRRRYSTSPPHLTLSHALKQQEYMAWKIEQLGEVFLAAPPISHVDRDGHASVHATSRVLPLFEQYYTMFYRDGKKRVTAELLARVAQHDFADAILAVWFGDDGYRSSGNGKSVGFCFGGLDEPTYEQLAQWFTALGFAGKLHQHMGRESYRYYLMTVQSAHRFRDAVAPYLPESMRYKLDIGPPRKIRRSRSVGPVAAVSDGKVV